MIGQSSGLCNAIGFRERDGPACPRGGARVVTQELFAQKRETKMSNIHNDKLSVWSRDAVFAVAAVNRDSLQKKLSDPGGSRRADAKQRVAGARIALSLERADRQ